VSDNSDGWLLSLAFGRLPIKIAVESSCTAHVFVSGAHMKPRPHQFFKTHHAALYSSYCIWDCSLCSWYIARFPFVSPTSSAEVKEWVELYLHSPNTPSWRGGKLKEKAQGQLWYLLPYLTFTKFPFVDQLGVELRTR
jgi:hypothetical protein